MIKTFEAVKQLKGPILIHVSTKKGKGYRFAEEDGARYHGVGKFDKAEGIKVVSSDKPTYTGVFGDTLHQMATENENIHAITAAMPSGTGLSRFKDSFPIRFHDVGIAEGHAITFAAGLASAGQRPVVAVYSTFLQRAVDMVIHDVALQKLPVIFAIDRAGVVGEDGPTHHGVFDLTFLRMIPNMVVMAPRDEDQLRHMLATGMARTAGPSSLRYPRGNGLGVSLDTDPTPLEIGKSETLVKGKDVAILAVGSMVYPALEAGRKLAQKGISAEVVDMRFVKPLDIAALKLIWSQFKKVVTVEENALAGGFGSGVLEWAAGQSNQPGPRVLSLGIGDQFQEHASRNQLLEAMGLTAEGISKSIEIELNSGENSSHAQSAS